MRRFLTFYSLLFLCLAPSALLAQSLSDCPTYVNTALEAVSDTCQNTGRNQLCYGNIQLDATPRMSDNFTFQQPGDLVGVENVEDLRLSSLDLTSDVWGIALMKIQANLPDTLPGQNVVFLLFGDVEVTNKAAATTELIMISTGNVNVRRRPSTSGNNIISSLKTGQAVTANGRLADNSWIRILVDPNARTTGWVSASFLSTDRDINSLGVVEASAPLFGPMQAFYLKTGLNDRPCVSAPDSGVLIQSPESGGTIQLNINGADVTLGSTLYLQADSHYLTVNVVEGKGTVSAGGVTQTIPEGTFSQIPLDPNGTVNGTPSFPQPYDYDRLKVLPVKVGFPKSVQVALPPKPEQINNAVAAANDLPVSFSGGWNYSGAEVLVCDKGYIAAQSYPISIDFYGGGMYFFGETCSKASEGVYNCGPSSPGRVSFGSLGATGTTSHILRFGNEKIVTGETIIAYNFDDGSTCTVSIPFTMTR